MSLYDLRMNRYLSGNCIPWLLEESHPEIRYLTLKDIIGDGAASQDLAESRRAIRQSARLKQMLAAAGGGVLGDSAHFDIFYRGSMWCFAEAVERGLDRGEPEMEKTAGFLFSRCQKPSGGFILNWKPEIEVSCRTGDMVRHLVRAGYDDERVRRAVEWILEHQRADGGWLHCPLSGKKDVISLLMFRKAGSGLARETDPGVPSCVFATAACLSALVHYNEIHRNCSAPIAKAAEFLLSNRLFLKAQSRELPICLGGYREGDFSLPGYPVLSQYDVLYGLMILARAGFFSDPRTGEAFNHIVSRQNDDGSWNLENTRTGMLNANGDEESIPDRKSKWVTLNVMRLFKFAGMLEP